ncbi:hypothetical protein LPJ64_005716 [Coemansia asiatica]|uniref:Mitochondrial carrier protein n=1 Tax=Coemansia asiatica TaxID=1052880 RepID=A0A9W7XH56_9FUNG|nr:hypothetical protein LPJ64_005716 [Coemansia asiatica]KAJ2884742.1 hypothetical protein FB639_001907 [Coemansia asiatica]
MASKKDAPAHSLIAGIVAGAVEGAATYPTELIKTKMQLQTTHKYTSPLSCLQHTLQTQGPQGLYRGLAPMLLGNALKAGVRFLTYDTIKEQLRDSQGRLTMPQMMCAGMCAGITEGALVVAPTEAVKTRLIHDHCMPKQRYSGARDCLREVLREGGLYRGVGPVMARQGANSCVRFAAYDSLKQIVVKSTGKQLTGVQAFFLGMCAGIVTVYATMPLDVVKTRMQGMSDAGAYKSSVRCAVGIVTQDGVWALWRGATPRLARLMFSGAIVFAVYEQNMKLLRKATPI